MKNNIKSIDISAFEILWTGKNVKEVRTKLNQLNINSSIVTEREWCDKTHRNKNVTSLYIDSEIGYIEPNTMLTVSENYGVIKEENNYIMEEY